MKFHISGFNIKTIIDIRISGIPCQAKLISYDKGWRGSHAEPPETETAEFEILDSKGYKAQWLDDKMTDAERQDIEEKIIKAYHDDYAEAKASWHCRD